MKNKARLPAKSKLNSPAIATDQIDQIRQKISRPNTVVLLEEMAANKNLNEIRQLLLDVLELGGCSSDSSPILQKISNLGTGLMQSNLTLVQEMEGLAIDHKKYVSMLHRFQVELKGFFDLINNELLTRKGNTTKRQKVVNKVLQKLNKCEEKLDKLSEDLYRDAKKKKGGQISSFIPPCIAALLFIGSCFTGHTATIVIAGGLLGVTCTIPAYINLGGTSREGMNQLKDGIEKFRTEVTKYHTELEVLLLTDELYDGD